MSFNLTSADESWTSSANVLVYLNILRAKDYRNSCARFFLFLCLVIVQHKNFVHTFWKRKKEWISRVKILLAECENLTPFQTPTNAFLLCDNNKLANELHPFIYFHSLIGFVCVLKGDDTGWVCEQPIRHHNEINFYQIPFGIVQSQ